MSAYIAVCTCPEGSRSFTCCQIHGHYGCLHQIRKGETVNHTPDTSKMVIERVLPNGVVIARETEGLRIQHNFASMADYKAALSAVKAKP